MEREQEIAERVVIAWVQEDCRDGFNTGMLSALQSLSKRVAAALTDRLAEAGALVGAQPVMLPSKKPENTTARRAPATRRCAECGATPVKARGLCAKHYERRRAQRATIATSDEDSPPAHDGDAPPVRRRRGLVELKEPGHGRLPLPAKVLDAVRCWVPSCQEPPRARGLCVTHTTQWLRAGGGVEAAVRMFGAAPPPGSPLPMVEQLSDAGVQLHRRTSCRAYSDCLSWAMSRRWVGFSCKACHGPSAGGGR